MYSTKLSWLQVLLTLLPIGMMVFSISFPQLNRPRQHVSSEEWKTFEASSNLFAIVTAGSFLLSLVILALNITIGSLTKINSKK